MTKRKKTSKAKKTVRQQAEPDSVFFMKLIFYFIFGALWLRVVHYGAGDITFSVPVGLLIGILFARHEHFMIDRKLEYFILLISTVLSFYLPVGIIIG